MVKYCKSYAGLTNQGKPCEAPAGKGVQEEDSGRCKDHREFCVLLLGFSGVGKTTLIQNFCGEETVPESKIGHTAPKTTKFNLYYGDTICFWDSEGIKPQDSLGQYIQNVKEFFLKEARKPHYIWYCISGPGARITPTDFEIMTTFHELEFPLTPVITKKDITSVNQKKSLENEILSQMDLNVFCVSGKKDEETEDLLEFTKNDNNDIHQAYENLRWSNYSFFGKILRSLFNI